MCDWASKDDVVKLETERNTLGLACGNANCETKVLLVEESRDGGSDGMME